MDKKLKSNIIKGSAATTIGTVSGMVFQFLTILIMTRYVSKEDLGIYFLVIVIVNMFNLLSGFGVEITMVKAIATESDEESRDALEPVLVIRAIGCVLFSAIFIFSGRYLFHLFDDRIYQYVWYILAIFLLANYRDLFYNLMQGLKQFKQYSIVNVVSSAFRVVITVVFIFFTNLDLRYLLIIEILATAQPLIHQLFVIPFKEYMKVKPTWKTYERIIKFSVPIYLNNLVVFLNGRAQIFIIGLYLNPVSIAYFSVANKVPVALKKIFQSFIIVYFPSLAKLFADGDRKTAVKLIEKSLGIFSVSMSLLVLFTFLFRNELTVLLFSAKYAEISLAFALLMLRFFIRGLDDLMGYPFVPAGFPSVPTKINAVASVISIILSIALVPIYGYMGAVYALLIMNVVTVLLFYISLHKHEINPRIRSFLKPATILLILPFSYLYNGKYAILYSAFLFMISLILGWFISNELKSGSKYLIKQIRNFRTAKNTF